MNSIQDQVAAFDIQSYQGNPLTLQLLVAGNGNMPTVVKSRLFYGEGGQIMPAPMQPTVTIVGRMITVNFVAGSYPTSVYHQLRFDNRIVLAGKFLVNYDTVQSADDSTVITVHLDSTYTVTVNALIGNQSLTDTTNAPDYVNAYQLYKQA